MATPAGWYPDPSKPNQYRWWDGAAWTDYTQAADAQPLAPPMPTNPGNGAPPPPPPPPSGGSGFPPPPPVFGVPTHYPTGNEHGYGAAFPARKASWGRRLAAALLDWIFCGLPGVAGLIIGFTIAGSTNVQWYSDGSGNIHGGKAVGWAIATFGGSAVSIALSIINLFVRQGRTGQSWGKRTMGLALVSASTGTTIGGGRAFARYVVAAVLTTVSCYIFGIVDYLWPLWDQRGQRVVDKMLGTVVIPCEDASQIRRK